jgi:DNA-binding NarL/FixJ family response regulator
MDFTPFMAQVRRNTDLSNVMLHDARLVVCLGSRALLAAFLGWTLNPDQVLGAATTEGEGLALVEQHQPTMVLLSDQLERGNGIALVQQIKARWPQIHTLLLITQEHRLRQIKAAIDACCDGLLVESRMGLGAGVAALQAVSGGGIYIDKSLQELFRRGHERGAPIEPLSPRELEVLALVAQGKRNSQIGATLYVSVDTVKTHISHLMRKLQANDRTHAAVLGLRWGLIDWPSTDVPR